VKIVVEVMNRRIINLTLCDVLYIPDLHSNLIFISKICRLGLAVIFGDNEAITSLGNNRTAIHGIRHESLYHFRTVDEPKVFVVKPIQELDTIDNWHYIFGHIGIEVIYNLYKKGLVLDLELMGQLQIAETCKDCIFPKMHTKPYNEKEILD